MGLNAKTGPVTSKLSWKHLTRKNFTMEHNMEIVRAHVKDPEKLQALMDKPSQRGIDLEETVFTLYTR